MDRQPSWIEYGRVQQVVRWTRSQMALVQPRIPELPVYVDWPESDRGERPSLRDVVHANSVKSHWSMPRLSLIHI